MNTEEKKGLSPQQTKKLKKYVVFTLMFAVFAASLWLIFSPSKKEKAKTAATTGFNSEIPLPKEEGIIGDKAAAYEQDNLKQQQEEKMRSLQDFSALFAGGGKHTKAEDMPVEDAEKTARPSSMESSAVAYQNVNRTLSGFYQPPARDYEKEQLRQEVEDLKMQLNNSNNHQRSGATDEQTALMEKSYQLAAKYLPQGNTQNTAAKDTASEKENDTAQPVTVSAAQPATVAAPLQHSVLSVPRGFITPTSSPENGGKNTFSACVYDGQTVMSGQSVKFRLLEPLLADNALIPENTLITGTAKIQGERMSVQITSLEYNGSIIPVKLQVYDTDGQQGIFIPDLQDVNAFKQIAAGMGTNIGTSINLTSNAGQQLAADMGRSLIQGTSQLFSKKLQDVKVHLKAGYKILLKTL